MKLRRIGASLLRITTAVFVILVVFALGIQWAIRDWYPLDAFAWHWHNGMNACVGDYRVPILIWERPGPDFGSNQLHMALRPRSSSFVTFKVGRRVTLGSQWREGWSRQVQSRDRRIAQAAERYLRMTPRKVSIAGQPTVCFEDASTIYCLPETQQLGLTVNFFGSREEFPHFYELLSKVTKAK